MFDHEDYLPSKSRVVSDGLWSLWQSLEAQEVHVSSHGYQERGIERDASWSPSCLFKLFLTSHWSRVQITTRVWLSSQVVYFSMENFLYKYILLISLILAKYLSYVILDNLIHQNNLLQITYFKTTSKHFLLQGGASLATGLLLTERNWSSERLKLSSKDTLMLG